MEKAARILLLHQDEGVPYNPADDGFVFTQTQINQAILTRNRERVIAEAWRHRQKTVAA